MKMAHRLGEDPYTLERLCIYTQPKQTVTLLRGLSCHMEIWTALSDKAEKCEVFLSWQLDWGYSW